MRPLFLLLCAALLLGPATAAATTWYVSVADGSVGGAGTIDDPFLYIQQGLDAAAATGDVVLVKPGTYTGAGNRDLATLGKAVIVRGQLGPAVTIIDVGSSAHDGFFLDDTGEDRDTRIESLTIRGARYGIRLRLPGTAPVIEDCVFELNTGHGLFYEYTALPLDALDVIDCTFRDHPDDAVHLDIRIFKHAAQLRRDPFAILSGCVFEDNATAVDSDMPLTPLCRVEDSDFVDNDLATYGSLALLRCDVIGGVDGFAGEVEYEPHHIHVTDCDVSGLTGLVFDDAQEIYVTGCRIDGNAGDIHAGGPFEEAYEFLAFEDCEITNNGGGLTLDGGYVSQATLSLIDCVYAANGGPVRFAHYGGFGTLTVTGSTLAHNTGDALVVVAAHGGATIANTIIAANGGRGLDWQYGTATWSIGCCDIWDNAGGDYVGLADQTGLNDNIAANPLFCDPAAGDYHLRADSLCLPGATGCGLMGARDVGCEVPTTWFVATWGSDATGTGSPAYPFRTVAHGLAAAAAGDTVAVHDGTYPEHLEITRGVMLRSVSGIPPQCVLAGIADHRVLTIHGAPDTVRIRGVEIRGGRPHQDDYDGLNPGGGVLVYGPPLVMENCDVVDNATPLDETATGGGGIHARDGSYLRLVGCRLRDNTSFRAGGILQRSAAPLEMYGCLVHHNHSERQAGGVWILPSGPGATAVIAASTIVENTATLNGGGLEIYLTDLVLDHTIVAFNTGGDCQVVLNDCTGTLDCNDLYDPDGGCVFDAAPALSRPTDIEADPWFCRKWYGDYRLLDDSPCLVGACGRIGALGEGCTYTAAPQPAPDATVLRPPRPNPFNARVVLDFALARPGHARLDVLDVRGALVVTVMDDDLPGGPQSVTWAGVGANGRPAAAGVYLVRLATEDGVQTRRMALVK